MKTAELNDHLFYDGQLVKVVGIAEGKMVIMEPIIDANDHTRAGEYIERPIYVLEHSKSFQECAEPIPTIKDPKP